MDSLPNIKFRWHGVHQASDGTIILQGELAVSATTTWSTNWNKP